MTLADLKERVLDALEESSSNSLRYPAATVEEYLNDGAREYVVRTGRANDTVTITQNPYTLMYDLPTDLVQVERVEWVSDSKNYPVYPTTPRQLDNWAGQSRWPRDTGTRADFYFVFGLNLLALYPQITTSTATYTVHYQSYRNRPMAGDSSTPPMPLEDHQYLVGYAVGRCLLSEGKTDLALEEMSAWSAVLEAAKQRMSGADRQWGMR